jgi:hypothetical protein
MSNCIWVRAVGAHTSAAASNEAKKTPPPATAVCAVFIFASAVDLRKIKFLIPCRYGCLRG